MVLTPTVIAMLVLLLVAGWLFGLASHPGGAKWKARYAAEREAHAANRKAAEAKIATERARIAELERENTRLANAAPVTASTIGSHRRVAAVRPAYASGERPGWFDWKR